MGVFEDDEIVIAGLGGRFPDSDNVTEFWERLLNGEMLVTRDNRRWDPELWGLPPMFGKLKDPSRFDAEFFGIHGKQANSMDPQGRLLLETTYEAIIDAGVDPDSIRGSKTGVYVGCTNYESREVIERDPETVTGFVAQGTFGCMLANRVSFTFDFQGPSISMDTGCAASLTAFHAAIQDLRKGLCDEAIVGGTQLCLKPQTCLLYYRAGVLSDDGITRAYDHQGSGFGRAEAIVSVYLKRRSKCKRSYGSVLHSGINSDGYKEEGVTFPGQKGQHKLLERLYSEADIGFDELEFVETHGTATRAGDPVEGNALGGAVCSKRKKPLLIGSVKTNAGHAEGAAGLVSLAKLLYAFHKGVIIPNLNFVKPNPRIPAQMSGQLKVCTEETAYHGGICGLSGFGVGGVNTHIILKGERRAPAPESAFPRRLVLCSSRMKEGVETSIDVIRRNPDREDLRLLHDGIANVSVNKSPFRGFAIVGSDPFITEIASVPSAQRRKIWFVYPGTGAQWAKMGQGMMAIPIFRDTIQRLHAVVKKQDASFDLQDTILNATDADLGKSLIKVMTSITAIQIALTDCLAAVGIKPDRVFGHSLGELACAYADGCLTGEEVVLCSYWRSRCIQESNPPPGAMAAVGLSWEETKRRVPKGVIAACNNAEESVTISGDKDVVDKFVALLQSEGTFAKGVNSSGYASHSHHMLGAVDPLVKALAKITKNAGPRTERWVSTSLNPSGEYKLPSAAADVGVYQVNNLISPVRFKEALDLIEDNAITVEVAPHCLMKAILKRKLGPTVENIGLMNRTHSNNLEFFLTNLGKLYNSGINVDLQALYPSKPENFPVSVDTPMIGSSMRWDHSKQWSIPLVDDYIGGLGGGSAGMTFEIDISPESEYHYIRDHGVDGRILFPGTGYLHLVWKVIAKMQNTVPAKTAVELWDVNLHQATIIPSTGSTTLEVRISPASNNFEIGNGDQLAISGKVRVLNASGSDNNFILPQEASKGDIIMDRDDVYTELRLRGYEYGPDFQTVLGIKDKGQGGVVAWDGNWVTFLDGVLQVSNLSKDTGLRHLCLPTRIRRLVINPLLHETIADGSDKIGASYDAAINTCRAGGVEISGLATTTTFRRNINYPNLTVEELAFVPYNEKDVLRSDADLSAYSEVCGRYANVVVRDLRKNFAQAGVPFPLQSFKERVDGFNADALKSYQQEDSFGYLESLRQIADLQPGDGLLADVQDILNEGCKEDVLFRGLLQRRFLKNALDTVYENFTGASMKIVEVGALNGRLYSNAVDIFNAQPTLTVEYAVTGTADEVSQLREEVDSESIETSTWDISSAPPKDISDVDLILADGLARSSTSLGEALKNAKTALKDGGFLLLHDITGSKSSCGIDVLPFNTANITSDEAYLQALRSAGFEVISEKRSGLLTSLFLCRKVEVSQNGLPPPRVFNVNEVGDYAWVDNLKQVIAENEEKTDKQDIWLVSNTSHRSGIVGLVNCLRQESGGSRIRAVFVADPETADKLDVKDTLTRLGKQDLVMNVFKKGRLGSYRHCFLDTDARSLVETKHAFVNTWNFADLSSLQWIASPTAFASSDTIDEHHSLCDVYYSALNFKDIMLATGRLPPDSFPEEIRRHDCLIGVEYSGKRQDGSRVMGILHYQGLATTVKAPKHMTFECPDAWTLEQAATVPVVYGTVYYAMLIRGQMRRGETVLIHSGSGGVGQAAIHVCLSMGCKVFTTTGSKQKIEFLKKRFPQLSDDSFAHSRDTSFEQHILRATNGRGVDVILNSLATDLLDAGLRLLTRHGRFIDIGKYDATRNANLGMSVFLNNTCYHGVYLDQVTTVLGNPDWAQTVKYLNEGIASGVVQPLTPTIFTTDEVEPAFRFMGQGKHIGKVLVKIRDEGPKTVRTPCTIKAATRTYCHPKKVYIIVGGIGGFGLELAQWLVDRGAKIIVLTSRSGVKTGYQANRISFWLSQGIQVVISKKDASNRQSAEVLVKESQKIGPIGGIFNLAMVLRDALIENQTPATFQECCAPKVAGTTNLDQVTRQSCGDELDWFVAFSSITSGRGNLGQANYGYANSLMERLVEKRREDGLHGLAIQWGVIGDVGVLANKGDDVVIRGCTTQRMTSCLTTLDYFLCQSRPVVSSFVGADRGQTSTSHKGKQGVVEAVMRIFGFNDFTNVNREKTLSDLGLDSIVGVEVRQMLERSYDKQLSLKEIGALTLNEIATFDEK